jgi:hypothetical protein
MYSLSSGPSQAKQETILKQKQEQLEDKKSSNELLITYTATGIIVNTNNHNVHT